MRLWSLHPKYLDPRGLLAVWREGLLAQAVLRGQTRGYVHHPQLQRFRSGPSPEAAIAEYLRAVLAESISRGYAFAGDKISPERADDPIVVTQGQLQHEWKHLMTKLAMRDPDRWARLANVELPEPHPLFHIVPGVVEPWERSAR